MTELYIFSQDDSFITVLTKDTGLTDTWFKDYQNHIPDESFVFNIDSNSPLLKHIKEENQVAFFDRDNELRLVRMKELYEVSTKDGHNIRVKCEPSYLELYDHFIEDKRVTNGTAQTALNRVLDGSRYVGEVTVDLGNATDNFYWINGIDAVWKILDTWGGSLVDTITLDDNNEIVERKLWIVQRLGEDNGLLVEPDYNAEIINRNTLSYPETALWGQGASLPMEDEDGELTGGHTRYITFEDVEWKVSNGDPVDKPKGQKWVGDPQALEIYGYPENGIRKHREGHFSNQDYDDPEELLWATWNELQDRKLKEVIHEATIYESDKKVSLGDTATVLNRNYNKPIELQSQITGLEYDILYPDDEIKIVVGKYIDMNQDPLQKEIDDLKETVNRPRPERPVNNDSFPDIKPGTPTNVEAHGSFRWIQLFWDYDSDVYISHYEVYGSRIADFVPDEQHLLYRGRVSSFNHEVDTDEKWYYYVRAVNTRGTAGDFSNQVEASSVRIINDDILFGSITADKLEDNLDLANKLSEGTLDWINDEPLYEIRESENRILNDVGNRIGDVLNDIDLINDDLGDLHYQDFEINERIDGLSSVVQDTEFTVNDLTDELEHQSTQISNWEQRADGFEQSVVDIEGDLENAWTEMSLIEQTAKDLTFSIGELEGDIEDTQSNILAYINLSKEGIRIHGDRVSITGQTFIEEGVIGTAEIAELAVDRFHLKYGIIDTVHIEDAAITDAKIHSLNVDKVIAGQMSIDFLKAGTINTDKFLVRGGSATDYTMIDGSYLETRGRYERTWLGNKTIHDSTVRIRHGYIRMREETTSRSLFYMVDGISTFMDGEGEYQNQPGSSGTIQWWDTTYSPSRASGITMSSYGGAVALRSDLSHVVLDSNRSLSLESQDSFVYIRPFNSYRGNQTFAFNVIEDSNTAYTDGFMMYGSEVNGYGVGLRYSKTTLDPTISVVDTNYSRGGNTTFDVGNLKVNDIRKRTSNTGVYWNGTSGGSTDIAINPDVFRASGIRANVGAADIFLATHNGAVRVTDHYGYNEGKGITYKPIAVERVATMGAKSNQLSAMSSIFNRPAPDEDMSIVNNLDMLRVIDGPQASYEVLGESAITFLDSVSGTMARDTDKATMYALKAIQELDKNLTVVDDRLDKKDLEIQYLKQKVKQQDKEINKLKEMVA